MSLTLENVTQIVGGQYYINQASLTFAPDSFNVLLGCSLSGKTNVMSLMAGLEKPTTGDVTDSSQCNDTSAPYYGVH